MLSNKYMAMAIDNSLGGSTNLSGLRHFLPKVAPRPLKPCEERFFSDLPENMQWQGSSTRRSGVWCKDTNITRIDVPRSVVDNHLHRPSLHKTLDEGSVGLPMTQWLDLHRAMRGNTTEELPYATRYALP